MAEHLSKTDYYNIDFADPASLLEHAKKLEGHTFQDVLDLGIEPEGSDSKQSYDSKKFKGGVGNLIEEGLCVSAHNDSELIRRLLWQA